VLAATSNTLLGMALGMTSGSVMGDSMAAFGAVAYPRPFRRYQQLALDAFEAARAAGERRSYLVLPPGAGKTVLGLEIARRLGSPTLVLTPNTAVQAQWLRQWADFQPALVPAGADPQLSAPLTVLTYQALCTFETDDPSLDSYARSLWRQAIQDQSGLAPEVAEQDIERLSQAGNAHFRAELTRYRRKARTLIARGGRREDLLALLHPNGRQLVERMKATGSWTLILDECHHLLETWGYLVRALIEELGDATFVVGLTATPPGEMDTREAALYRDLFGHAAIEAIAPALVKEGILAPYQELVYLTQPFSHEAEYVAAQHTRFERLLLDLLDPDFATRSFVAWLVQRVRERRSRDGAQVSWMRFERDHPTLAQAALRFFHHQQLNPPEDARLREQHRRPLDADDWVALIEDYCIGYLKHSPDARDEVAWEEIRQALPSLGYLLTRQGIRTHVSPVDRVLQLSASKAAAAVDILSLEQRSLGTHLRALILCDYERAGSQVLAKLRGVLDPQAGSAALLMHILLGNRTIADLDPLLVTGRTVACSRASAVDLCAWIEAQVPQLRGGLSVEPLLSRSSGNGDASWDDLVVLQPKDSWWRPRNYVPLLTRYFEEGKSRCLVGTRGLLGEGWDAACANVLVDLTAAGTSTAVHQMRGRTLRLDPLLTRKVANNWDVVCIEPDHPKGDVDYARFVRKHRNYYALTLDGTVESGVSHVHPELSPYGPPDAGSFAAINQAMRQRAQDRDRTYEQWQVGAPYENMAMHTLRIRLARREALTPRRLRGLAPVGHRWPTVVDILRSLLGAAGDRARTLGYRSGSVAALEDFGAAIAGALREAGAISPGLGPHAVRITVQSDGYYRCTLSGAAAEESRLFAECLDELLAPLSNPRYIIPIRFGGARDLLRSLLSFGRAAERRDENAVYHAVPSYFAGQRARVEVFTRAWNRYVSRGTALYVQDSRAQVILSLQRGTDPFGVTSHLRTAWT
jgi:superfamily II DNA or RNA helicase